MKIQCPCGAKYAFDLTPEMAREPVKFVCPQCGLDSSEIVNQLVQEELAEQNLPAVPAPPDAPLPPLKSAPARLKITHTDRPVAPPSAEPASPPANYVSKYCQKHSGVLATEKCVVCGKPICPKCMEMFGYFCSPLCKNKADLEGMDAPVYAGQRFSVEKRYWRKTGSIFGSLFAVLVVALGIWIWYAWFGSVPHPAFSVLFADDDRGYAGGAELTGDNQIVFLHGGTLARYDLKTGKPIWSRELVSKDQIDAIVKEVVNGRALANQQAGGDEFVHTPAAGADERNAKIELQDSLTLRVSGQDIYVASPEGITQYAWDDGKTMKVTPVSGPAPVARNSSGGGLLANDGKPMDPNVIAQQVQGLNLPARIALPALLANAGYEQKLEAALRDTDGAAHPRVSASSSSPVGVENMSLVAGQTGLFEFSVKMLQENFVTREAMRAAPRKSALNNPNLNVSQTADVANEILNEMQRNKGGDTITEDESRYQVTVHIPGDTSSNDWTGEVIGPPELFALKTVNVIAAGKTVIVLDPSNKKIWDTTTTYPFSARDSSAESRYGNGPVVEHGGTLYVFDQAVLGAFDLMTGTARWRVPSVGVVGLFFDGEGKLYVNTTTGNPDDIKYARQIDVTKSTEAVLMKMDPATGKTLWSIKPGGFVAYLTGKFIYTLQSYDPNPTDEDVLNDSLVDLQKPPYLRITRIDPDTGRTRWDYEDDRCPVSVQFENNQILLIFKREVQLLKYLTL
ncbi:MAG TPA: PQQ-binding-like beta-propeller repeat protein [Candidatus Acidoferrum sp.]|nr:PQQ-binding-like beta-propeller repeat protein [Candidatus Acidoferrum sp.]